MKTHSFSIVLCLFILFSCNSLIALPRIIILATGGTIAGSAKSSTQASYQPGVISIDEIIQKIPDLQKIAQLKGIQICNISSQNMELEIWIKLHQTIDSLFRNKLCDGIVVTHGTDTMEESAFFLQLTLKHSMPVVFVGSMRPSTSISADGPFNLYNAVALAGNPSSKERGVMIVMNDYIYSADDVTKSNTVNPNAFSCPNYGPLGTIRDGKPVFFRTSLQRHTTNSEFSITSKDNFPKVEIVYAYSFSSDVVIKSLITSKVDGIILAGVGHGNFNSLINKQIDSAINKGICIVRSTRVFSGGVDTAAEGYNDRVPVAFTKNPQKSRILLMLALLKTRDPKEIQRVFQEY